ncbi:MAG: dipeptide/oligopeptide/nickel ABC transporter permease/ATP-binding protein, partial [Thermomicrobiales bacterium]|nr:dipeptide/oligopeptide/nickel ABC transporter permease/ATP-binding protein [Thermomicrobiales bacterium]
MSTSPLSTEMLPVAPVSVGQPGLGRRLLGALRGRKVASASLCVLAAIALVAIFAPLVAPHDPLTQNLGDNFKPPMWKANGTSEYPLGTDPLGRDLLSRLIYGARYSLAISAGSVVLGCAIGFLVGLLAGFFGRWTDIVLMRLGDIQLAFPFVLFAIAVLAVSPQRTVWQIILVLGLSSWVIYARVVRSRVLAEREKDYARAARALGASPARVLFRYVMPNVWQAVPPICLLNLAFFVIVESLLSFLALGLSSPTPSWGAILADGRQFMMVSPWMAILPGVAILVTTLSISLAADELADVFDPKLAHGSARPVPVPAGGEPARFDPNAPLLRVRGLSTEFPGRNRTVRALRGVDLDLERGEVLGIVGESGSGKSTLGLSIIGLLDAPGRIAEGEVRFKGADLARASKGELSRIRGTQIGMVFQDPGNSLNPVLTVGYQLREALRCSGNTDGRDLAAAGRAALVTVNIADPDRVMRAYPFQLSGGMQQRVMIALAMVGRPDLLILDEPTSALDVTTQAQFLDELDGLQAQTGMSMIFITHDIALLSDFADKILVLYAGTVCEVGPSDVVL